MRGSIAGTSSTLRSHTNDRSVSREVDTPTDQAIGSGCDGQYSNYGKDDSRVDLHGAPPNGGRSTATGSTPTTGRTTTVSTFTAPLPAAAKTRD